MSRDGSSGNASTQENQKVAPLEGMVDVVVAASSRLSFIFSLSHPSFALPRCSYVAI